MCSQIVLGMSEPPSNPKWGERALPITQLIARKSRRLIRRAAIRHRLALHPHHRDPREPAEGYKQQ